MEPTSPAESPSPKPRRRWVPWVVAGLIGLIVGVALGGGTEVQTETTTEATTVAETTTVTQPASTAELDEVKDRLSDARAKLKTTKSKQSDARSELSDLQGQVSTAEAGRFDGDGTYVVGEDIQPGTYRAAAQDGCYWARLSSLNTSDIIDNDNATGPVVVEVQAGDKAFLASGCSEFKKAG